MNNTLYYIYEILGVKIGCTIDFERRQRAQRKKGKMVLLETHTDLDKASERERELQLEKGYPTDSMNYIAMLKRQRLGAVAAKTPEAIKKNSEARKGKPMPWMQTKEAKKKRKKSRKENYKPWFHSEETKKIMAEKTRKRLKGVVPTHMLTPEARAKSVAKTKKAVEQYTKDDKFIKEWLSAMDVYRELGIHNANVGACCAGKVKSAGGYIWKYA